MKETSHLSHPTGLREAAHSELGVERLENLIPRRDRGGRAYYQCPPTFRPFEVTGATFPFPLVERGRRTTFIFTADRIGAYNETLKTGSWFPFSSVALTAGLSLADYGDVWVVMAPSYTAYRDTNGNCLSPTPIFSCCCGHGDRFIAANNTDKRVYWGSPLGDDLSVMLGVSGATRTTKQLNREDFGSAPYIFQGDALAMKLLGDDIVVYGEDGINILTENGMKGYDPHPVIGISPNVGIKSARAVVGGLDAHVFLGSDGALYSVGPGGKGERVSPAGYREFLNDLSSPIMSMDHEQGDIWIVDATSSYCFTEAGLGGPLDLAPYGSVLLSDGTVLKTGRPYATGDAVIFEVVSSQFDFGESGCFAVTELQIGADEFHHLRGGMYYRYSTRENWRRTSRLKAFSREGSVNFPMQCTQGKSIFSGTLANPDLGGKIRRMEVRKNITDKRYRRGTKILGGGVTAPEE